LFLVSNGIYLSTPQLIDKIAEALGEKAFLLPFPIPVLRMIGLLMRQFATMRRLTDSLCVSNLKIAKRLRWKPHFSVEEGIAETVRFYKKAK
jgi:hypothetical protein